MEEDRLSVWPPHVSTHMNLYTCTYPSPRHWRMQEVLTILKLCKAPGPQCFGETWCELSDNPLFGGPLTFTWPLISGAAQSERSHLWDKGDSISPDSGLESVPRDSWCQVLLCPCLCCRVRETLRDPQSWRQFNSKHSHFPVALWGKQNKGRECVWNLSTVLVF